MNRVQGLIRTESFLPVESLAFVREARYLCVYAQCRKGTQKVAPNSERQSTCHVRHSYKQLACMKEGSLALARRCTAASSRSGSTGPIADPAFRKRCMMRSPTKIPPDSEKVGERNRPRSPKMRTIPFAPSPSCLIHPFNGRNTQYDCHLPFDQLFAVFPYHEGQVDHPVLKWSDCFRESYSCSPGSGPCRRSPLGIPSPLQRLSLQAPSRLAHFDLAASYSRVELLHQGDEPSHH